MKNLDSTRPNQTHASTQPMVSHRTGRPIAIRVSVCMFVCMPVHSYISEITTQTSRNLLRILPMAVAQSSSDDNAMLYVLPALWMTSCLHNDWARTGDANRSYTQSNSPGDSADSTRPRRSLVLSIVLLKGVGQISILSREGIILGYTRTCSRSIFSTWFARWQQRCSLCLSVLSVGLDFLLAEPGSQSPAGLRGKAPGGRDYWLRSKDPKTRVRGGVARGQFFAYLTANVASNLARTFPKNAWNCVFNNGYFGHRWTFRKPSSGFSCNAGCQTRRIRCNP